MDIYLLKLVGDWLSVLAISLISVFGIGDYQEKNTDVKNTSYSETVTVVNELIPHKIEYTYNPERSVNDEPVILVPGEDGLSYKYLNGETRILKQPINQVIELGTLKSAEYAGRLTNYGGDCRGCSKTATVACKTREGNRHSLFKDGIYYDDRDFGEVRIIAADLKGFPCGTMILIDNGTIDPFMAVVLDTGYTMRQQYATGSIWMDLAFAYEKDIRGARTGSKNTQFSVQRWGW